MLILWVTEWLGPLLKSEALPASSIFSFFYLLNKVLSSTLTVLFKPPHQHACGRDKLQAQATSENIERSHHRALKLQTHKVKQHSIYDVGRKKKNLKCTGKFKSCMDIWMANLWLSHLLQLFDLSFTEFQDDKRTRVKKETTLCLILGFSRSIVLKTQHQFLLS